MAEVTIGISKTVVETLVNKVKSAIKEEAEKWQILQRDIVFIRDEFEMMQSFLSTTGGEHMKNLVATTWVRQVRDLSYDTEDCIEFVLHLDTKRWSFRRLFSRLLRPNVIPTTIPLDQAIAEIKQLKSQAEDVNQRNIRYNLTGSSREQMRQTSSANHSTPGIIIEPRDAFDTHTCILDLARLITTEGNDLQVISVCGGGGDLGASSIIKKAYDDPKICKMFECRAWVKLMQPFIPHDFIRSLLAGFYANFPRKNKGILSAECSYTRWGIGKSISTSRTLVQFTKNLVQTLDLQDSTAEQKADVKVLATMKASEDSIARDFIQIIKNKPYLIVLEDLTSIVEWNSIRTFIPDMKNKSRIVVSTQHLEIANLCTGRPNIVGLLRNPSTDDSVHVLFKELPRNPRDRESRKRCTKQEIRGLAARDKSLVDDHWQKEHKLFGRKSEIDQLLAKVGVAFRSRHTNKVISLWGIAGVGKSFLVEAFYDHYADTFDSSAVVSAAHPFDITNLCQDLAHDLKPENNGEDICLRVRRHLELEDNWCLVVIDDLQSKEDWDFIEGNLISGAISSCIFAITREESVARHCARSDDAVFGVKGLNATAAHRLLEKNRLDEWAKRSGLLLKGTEDLADKEG
ncbi:hypothetical protein U9M48_001725 [Paspalum notatum var. saurae]|uniref:Uncharacterized protein n=1 Tax=Paspalum notatum var. saurae TaxID=547442 RepID=A0AAQ3PPZ2_PASNO